MTPSDSIISYASAAVEVQAAQASPRSSPERAHTCAEACLEVMDACHSWLEVVGPCAAVCRRWREHTGPGVRRLYSAADKLLEATDVIAGAWPPNPAAVERLDALRAEVAALWQETSRMLRRCSMLDAALGVAAAEVWRASR